jgi:ribose transport system permease protein
MSTRPVAPGAPESELDLPKLNRTAGYPSVLARLGHQLSPRRISIIYVTAIFLLLFALWIPHLFYTETTLKQLLYQQAVTAVAALAFLIPFTTTNFDLTVGVLIGVSSLGSTWLMVNEGLSVPLAIIITLIACGLIGTVTASIITVVGIDSIITTIAMMSIIESLGGAANDGRQVLSLPTSFTNLSSYSIAGIEMPFFYMLIVGAIIWYVLKHTPGGRYLYAIGGGQEAARLAGVRVKRLVFLAYIASAVMAGFAGIMVASRLGAGDFKVGSPYLFPAASAMFLGATQVTPGRYNVWGTVLSVYALGIIVQGLELGGAPYWLPEIADGVTLLAAVGIANRQRRG